MIDERTDSYSNGRVIMTVSNVLLDYMCIIERFINYYTLLLL